MIGAPGAQPVSVASSFATGSGTGMKRASRPTCSGDPAQQFAHRQDVRTAQLIGLAAMGFGVGDGHGDRLRATSPTWAGWNWLRRGERRARPSHCVIMPAKRLVRPSSWPKSSRGADDRRPGEGGAHGGFALALGAAIVGVAVRIGAERGDMHQCAETGFRRSLGDVLGAGHMDGLHVALENADEIDRGSGALEHARDLVRRRVMSQVGELRTAQAAERRGHTRARGVRWAMRTRYPRANSSCASVRPRKPPPPKSTTTGPAALLMLNVLMPLTLRLPCISHEAKTTAGDGERSFFRFAAPRRLTRPRPTARRATLPSWQQLTRAQMAELVDAPASGAGDRKVVEVRVLFWAPLPLSRLGIVGFLDFRKPMAHKSCHT